MTLVTSPEETQTLKILNNNQSKKNEESEEELEATDAGQIQGRDGTRWRMFTDVNGRRGRMEQQNVFSERVGPTGVEMTIRTPRDAFLQLINEWSIRHIVNCTKDRAR